MALGRIAAITGVALLVLWLGGSPRTALAQFQPPSDYLEITADRAYTWTDGPTSVVQVQGPVTIKTDRATLRADRAVVWLTPLPGTVLDRMRAEIALIGNATVEQTQAVQTAGTYFVTTQIRGNVRITAEERVSQDLSDSDLYRDATAMRPLTNFAPGAAPPTTQWITQRPWLAAPPEAPTTAPATQPRPTAQFSFHFGDADTITLPDDKVGAMLWNGVTIVEVRPNRDVIQLQADRVVLFTPLASLQALTATEKLAKVEEVVTAVYLEGDVRITLTPGTSARAEQRLRANRVYYDLTTDQAVLTDAVIHTIEPQRQVPVILRAHLVRQLSLGEYKAEGTELSTSSFAVPSYSINSDRAYVREYDTGDPRLGQRIVFDAENNTFKAFHVPVFWWPWTSGSMTERGFPLREILLGSSRGFGPGIRTTWGFFETLGKPPPKDLDIQYHLDYYGDRGPGGGVDVKYGGGFITETTKQAWNFEGDLQSYFVEDHGEDRLGHERRTVEPESEFRYQVQWKHQQFFPQDWQLQLRAGLLSDPTFREEWFQKEFNDGLPSEMSAYLKHQQQSEALTLLVQWHHDDFVSTADQLQEQFEVEHLPEVGYYRVGDSLADDKLTFFSANTLAGLHFNQSDASYAELGFRPGQDPFPPNLPAGFPSQGQTGVTDDTTYRGDFRQEVDYPFTAGQFKFLPYVFGRYTGYSDSPGGDTQNRVFVGTGMRVNTAFWKVDDSAKSDLFDIHRVRHVIEPELHLFTSASNKDPEDLFIYDEQVDNINDVSAAQIALHQRWQTKRGGAGQWRNVDFFTLNIEANFFANQPPERDLVPTVFRSLYFPSLPEASIPRNGVNADALWRVSDSTAILSDMYMNTDEMTLATASVGAAVQRDTRLAYFLGLRYIGELNSTIASAVLSYDLSAKYALRVSESVNISTRQNQDTAVSVVRRYDKFFMVLTFFYDQVNDDSGFRFSIFPEGFAYGLSTDQLQQYIGGQQ